MQLSTIASTDSRIISGMNCRKLHLEEKAEESPLGLHCQKKIDGLQKFTKRPFASYSGFLFEKSIGVVDSTIATKIVDRISKLIPIIRNNFACSIKQELREINRL